jgi:hypothetical protein
MIKGLVADQSWIFIRETASFLVSPLGSTVNKVVMAGIMKVIPYPTDRPESKMGAWARSIFD